MQSLYKIASENAEHGEFLEYNHELENRDDNEIYDDEVEYFIRCYIGNNEFNYHSYGPSNPKIGIDIEKKCGEYEVCYMLNCKCLEEFPEDIKGNEWFSGICDYCNFKIENKQNSWRIPGENGCFEGCYCSYEHTKINLVLTKNYKSLKLLKIMKVIRDKYPIYIYNIKNDENQDEYL